MTMTRADDAAAVFTDGFSCSQAVCLAFAEDFGIDREATLKLSCAPGEGWHIRVNPCEAVTGALMVIGMKYGRSWLDDLESKEKTYTIANTFMTEFYREITR